jgi:hypothetical protein
VEFKRHIEMAVGAQPFACDGIIPPSQVYRSRASLPLCFVGSP